MKSYTPFLCPKCGEKLNLIGKSWVCPNNHCYDIAKSGYINLLLVNQKNSLSPGDNKDMIVARNRVMNKGYYKKLADKIVEIIPKASEIILDAGCGIGYIPNRIKEANEKAIVIGADISKFAIESAAKNYKNVHFAVATSNNIPIPHKSVDVIICAFAPVFVEEVNRVLKSGGIFVRVVPNLDHLYNLKQYVYDVARENELDKEALDNLKLLDTFEVKDNFIGDSEDMLSLIKMTPYYYHTKEADLDKLKKIDNFCANQSFLIRVYSK
ncbi:MAG: methyltransferase domain-containing protein [Clostridia bacterium]